MSKLRSAIIMALIFTMLVLTLGGCGKEKDKSAVTKGEWVELLAEVFGLEGYNTQEPVFADIKPGDPLFDIVQSCYDWEILDNSDKKFNPDEIARTEFALQTALKAAEVEVAEEDVIQYAIDNNIIKSTSYMDAKGKLDDEKATQILNWCAKLFVEAPLKEEIYDVVMNEALVDASDDKNITTSITYEPDETGSVVAEDIVIKEKSADNQADHKVGEVVIFPGDALNPGGIARKIVGVKDLGDGNFEYITEEPSIEEVLVDFHVETQVVPEADKFIPAEGVKVLSGAETIGLFDDDSQAMGMVVKDKARRNEIINTADKGASISLEVNLTKGGLTFNKQLFENLSVDLFDVTGSAKSQDAGTLFEKEGVIPDRNLWGKDPFNHDQDINDYKAGKISQSELKERLNLDKDGQEKHLFSNPTYAFSGGYEIVGKLALNNVYVTPKIELKKVLGIPVGFKEVSFELHYKVVSSLDIKGNVAASYNLGVVPIPVAAVPGLSINLNVGLEVSANGKIEVKATIDNNNKITYKDGNIKKTSTNNTDLTASVNATISVGPYFAANATMLGLKVIELKVNAVAMGEFEAYLSFYSSTDISPDLLIHTRGCIFGKKGYVYAPVITLSLNEDRKCAGSKFGLKGKWTVLPKDKAHKWKLFDDTTILWEVSDSVALSPDETDPSTDIEGEILLKRNGIITDSYTYSVDEGKSVKINIESLPEKMSKDDNGRATKYAEQDLVYSSSDTSIATVSGDGWVTGISEGTVKITISTKDGSYSSSVTVFINSTEKKEFTPLSSVGL